MAHALQFALLTFMSLFLAYTTLQLILIPLGIFLSLPVLMGACFFLFLKYQSRVKYWFQAPPNIPEQIKEVSVQIGSRGPSGAGWHTPEPAPTR